MVYLGKDGYAPCVEQGRLNSEPPGTPWTEGDVAAFWSGFFKGLSANSAVYNTEYGRDCGVAVPEMRSKAPDIDLLERQRNLVRSAERRFSEAVRSALIILDHR